MLLLMLLLLLFFLMHFHPPHFFSTLHKAVGFLLPHPVGVLAARGGMPGSLVSQAGNTFVDSTYSGFRGAFLSGSKKSWRCFLNSRKKCLNGLGKV